MTGLVLSYEQEQMWIIYQLDRSSAAYSVPYVQRLRGELDVKEEGLREAGRALLDAVGESGGPSFVESQRTDVGSVTNTKGTGMLWMAMPGCLASQADFSYLPAAREAECVDTASKEYGDYQWEDTDGQEEHFPTLCDSV